MAAGENAAVLEADQIALRASAAEILSRDVGELTDWKINRIREDGNIDAEVPLAQLDVKDFPVDPMNVDYLKDNMDEYAELTGGTGQRDPGVACDVAGEALYLADGFHRHEAQKLRGEPRLHLTIEPNQTYAEVVRRRLEYADTHKEIEFSRHVKVMQSAWERTEWSKKVPNLLTAFRALRADYADYRTDDIELIDGLTDSEYDAMCGWVRDATKSWGYKNPDDIRKRLGQADGFDIELMKLVYQRSGTPPDGRIGIKHVEVISEYYPGEGDIQEAIVAIVTEEKLTAAQTKELIERIEEYTPMTGEDIPEIMGNIDISDVRSKARATNNKTKPTPTSKGSLEKAKDLDLLEELKERLPFMRKEALRGGEWSDVELGMVLADIIGLSAAVGVYVNSRKGDFDNEAVANTAADLSGALESLGELVVLDEAGMKRDQLPGGGRMGIDGYIEVETELTRKSRETMLAYLTGEVEEIPRISTRLSLQRAHEVLAINAKGWSRKRRQKFEEAVIVAEDRLSQREERRRSGRRH